MATKMNQTTESTNKAVVLEAFDTLFNKRDYAAAGRFWSTDYIQHSAHIAPGRDGLFDLIKSAPATLKYDRATLHLFIKTVLARRWCTVRRACSMKWVRYCGEKEQL